MALRLFTNHGNQDDTGMGRDHPLRVICHHIASINNSLRQWLSLTTCMLKVVSGCTCWHRCDHLDLLRVKMQYTDIFTVLKNYIWNTHRYFCQRDRELQLTLNSHQTAKRQQQVVGQLLFSSVTLFSSQSFWWFCIPHCDKEHTQKKRKTQKLNIQLNLQHFSITHWPPQNCICYMRRQNQLAAQKYLSKDVKPLWRLETDSIFFEVTYLPRALFLLLSVYWHM